MVSTNQSKSNKNHANQSFSKNYHKKLSSVRTTSKPSGSIKKRAVVGSKNGSKVKVLVGINKRDGRG